MRRKDSGEYELLSEEYIFECLASGEYENIKRSFERQDLTKIQMRTERNARELSNMLQDPIVQDIGLDQKVPDNIKRMIERVFGPHHGYMNGAAMMNGTLETQRDFLNNRHFKEGMEEADQLQQVVDNMYETVYVDIQKSRELVVEMFREISSDFVTNTEEFGRLNQIANKMLLQEWKKLSEDELFDSNRRDDVINTIVGRLNMFRPINE